jgi:M6 family metalloprotease-like protein
MKLQSAARRKTGSLRARIALAVLVLGAWLAPPFAHAEAPPPGTVPRPCFVPSPPQRLGVHVPVVEPPSSPRAGVAGPGLGGPAFRYHDDHLSEAGIQLGTGDPFPRQVHAIAVLVDFDDQPMGSEFVDQAADSTRLLFERVLTDLSQMYDEMSDGQLTVTWELTPKVYRLPQTMAWYGLDDSIATREAALCRDAIQAADPDVDYGRFDRFILFHAGAGQEADINDDSREQIWSVFFRQVDFQYWLDTPDAERGIRTADTDARGDTIFVPNVVVLPETESQDGYPFGIMGTVAHEFGHSFGLPDLYDTTGPADFIYADSQGIGAFGLMGSGIWNDNGFFPAEFCAWSKFYMGWLRPTVIRPDDAGGERSVAVRAVEVARRDGAVRIPMGGDEYLLIENRVRDYNGNGKFDFHDVDGDSTFTFWGDDYQGAELDYYLPRNIEGPSGRSYDGSGLLIWHIDESTVRDLLYYNLVNADALHKGVDLEEADGIQDLDKLEFTFEAFGDARDSYWAPNATELTPFTTPNTDGYNNARTGIWITDVSAPGDTMTFKVRFTSPDGNAVGDFKPGWPRDLPGRVGDFQPVAGDLDGDGGSEIVAAATDTSGIGGPVILRADGTSFLPPEGPPRLLSHGRLRSNPILVNLNPDRDDYPEVVWVSGDTLYAMLGNGVYLGSDGTLRTEPEPFYVLPGGTGRVHLTAANLDRSRDDRPEILVSAPVGPDSTEVMAVAYTPDVGSSLRTHVTYPGDASLPSTMADEDQVDRGLMEIATSVRTAEGGYLGVALLNEDLGPDGQYVAVPYKYSFGDTVAFNAPVVGDLNRDGLDEIVVVDSRGWLHALDAKVSSSDGITKNLRDPGSFPPAGSDDHAFFNELAGFPVKFRTVYEGEVLPSEDAVSLADLDGDGYLEILAFTPLNALHVYNYNGTPILSTPTPVPGEDRFTRPFLSPLVANLGTGLMDQLLLPMADGQVRGHDRHGRPIPGWAYLGGGEAGTYPVLTDLEGDGGLDLVTVEDVTVAAPLDNDQGDEAPGTPKVGRVVVREVGSGTPGGAWPVYRHDAARSGRAATPGTPRQEPGGTGLFDQAFVMPNPAVRTDPAIHYRIRSNVQRVTIEIHDLAGDKIRTLTGTVYPSTDNLVSWDRLNEHGHGVAPGLYLARVQAEAGSRVDVKVLRFVVVR